MESLKKVLLSAHNEQLDDADALAPEILSKLKTSRDALAVEGDRMEGDVQAILSEAWALGPKQVGPNLLTVGETVDGETGMPLRSLGTPLVGRLLGSRHAAPVRCSRRRIVDESHRHVRPDGDRVRWRETHSRDFRWQLYEGRSAMNRCLESTFV